MRPIERLRRLGLLSPALIAVHAVHLKPTKSNCWREHGCSVAHCPSSNLKLASGIAPITELSAQGVNMGLGTDGAASNNRLDLFQEMRLAALLAKEQGGRADAINAHRCCIWRPLAAPGRSVSTPASARSAAARRPTCVPSGSTIWPCFPVTIRFRTSAYAVGREHVSDVWVAGRMRVENGQLIENNETGLIKLALLWQNKIRP
jgi:5-methylthioadenosine/S-adenosylhomocysteine deaminase